MNSPFKVFVTDFVWPSLEVELSVLKPVGAYLEWLPEYTEESLLECVATADAILTCWNQVPKAALYAAANCRVVGRYGIGLDNIPVDLATELGILVTNVPQFCQDELSDQVMAFILCHARQISVLNERIKAGEWDRDTEPPMRRLRGQTLGLVGFGNTAKVLVSKAAAFGMRILAYTPRLRHQDLLPGVELASTLQDLLKQADYVSLHAPLTRESWQIIDAAALSCMKPTAFLINTARGGLVDESALMEALDSKCIAGAGLDVLVSEPPTDPIPWRDHPNVLMTPHSAFLSAESLQELAFKGATNVAQVLSGLRPANLVNPEVLGQENCRLIPN